MERFACPRCDRPLENNKLRKAEFQVCQSCAGVLVTQPHLTRLLRGLEQETRGTFDPHKPVDTVPDAHPEIGCPSCSRTMARFGYMESKVITLDRCSPCRLIWIDPQELDPMVRMYARVNHFDKVQRDEIKDFERRLKSIVGVTGSGGGAMIGGF